MAKKTELSVGDEVRVAKLSREPGAQLPEDVEGKTGVIEWITPGYAGEKSVFEVKLSDGRVMNLYAAEIEPA
jgi:hypothetical protein